MSGVIPSVDRVAFEDWIIDRYPEVFSEYELSEMAEYHDLDEFVQLTHYEIISRWFAAHPRRAGYNEVSSINC